MRSKENAEIIESIFFLIIQKSSKRLYTVSVARLLNGRPQAGRALSSVPHVKQAHSYNFLYIYILR